MQTRPRLLLCVDDDPDVLTFLRAVLEAEGFAVVTAESAEDAQRLVGARAPDAFIVDLMMEEVDSGLRFVRDLRGQGNTRPVFLLSSVGDTMSYTVETKELGISGIFQKPLQKKQFLSLLEVKLDQIRDE